MRVTVGAVINPQYHSMRRLRDTWEECDAIGVDRIYTADHFHAMIVPSIGSEGAQVTGTLAHENFEGGSIQAAMAVTTKRAEIGCMVFAIGYRNPNLLADMARTADHLSAGRLVLGLGAGYLKPDYEEYGYPFKTMGERLKDLEAGIKIIQDRFTKLNPKPTRKIPLLIAGLGEQVTLRLVATYADIWHAYGPLDALARKVKVLDEWCKKVGRNPADIERATYYEPILLKGVTPDDYLKLGFTHMCSNVLGGSNCTQDLSVMRELIQWRDRVNNQRES